MMRATVAVIGALSIVAGILFFIAPMIFVHMAIPAFPAFLLVAIGVAAIASLFFEPRYRSCNTADTSQWRDTGEKFVDPTSGKLVEVRYDPATGQRAYIDAEQ